MKTTTKTPENRFWNLYANRGTVIKGSVEYLQQGELFEQACVWVASINPERKVKGLILLTPQEIFDISPGKDTEKRMKRCASL